MQVLCGDIGGTKTRLTVVEVAQGRLLACHDETTVASDAWDSFDGLLRAHRPPGDYRLACFGVAGPVAQGRVRTTNLPWELDAAGLAAAFGLDGVWLLNDLEAFAWGIDALPAEKLVTIQAGAPLAGANQSVVAAGTGLGEAGRVWNGRRYLAFASEGGHADFAPAGDVDAAHLQRLRRQHEHVSWERVISGMGLPDLYATLAELRGQALPRWFLDAGADAGGPISERAAGGDALARETLERFFWLYGAEAGNHALKLMSRGGVYIGGGIAPRNLDWMQGPSFREGFLAKGRMRRLMETMPVHVILDDRTPLYGCGLYADHAAGQETP